MAKKPIDPDNPINRASEPTTISKEEAFEQYRAMYADLGDDFTIARCHKELMSKHVGGKLAYETLRKWAVTHEWRERCEAEVKERLLNQLRPYIPAMTDDALLGVQGKMIARLNSAIDQVVMVNTEQMRMFIECIAALSEIRGVSPSDQAQDIPINKFKEIVGSVRALHPAK